MYELEFTREAFRTLAAMPKHIALTIRSKLAELAKDPYAANRNATKLAARPGYRLRAGDWRVIYEIESDRLVIVVLRIKPRGGAYQ